MQAAAFFELLLDEIKRNTGIRGYYRFLDNEKLFHFRKSYYVERLDYLWRQVQQNPGFVWDCGCGYGTTGIFLALHGVRSHGTTLEYYYQKIPERLDYWNQFGDTSLFSFSYENVFDSTIAPATYDLVIVQDTLHHLEPLQEALKIFYKALKVDGKIIAIEENGSNIIQNAKLYMQRGNKRIIQVHDEKLGKSYWMGNENIRSLQTWKKELNKAGFCVEPESVSYVRLFPPLMISENNFQARMEQQECIWKRNSFLRDYFFFGLNFTASKAEV